MKVLPVNGHILVTLVEDSVQPDRKPSGLILNDTAKPRSKTYRVEGPANLGGTEVHVGALLFARSDAETITVHFEGSVFTFIRTTDVIGVLN